MGTGNKPPADPTARALHAAQECRDATRAAHEAMKGMREAEADLRALLAEAREFAAKVVPAEVKRQLDELGPATEAALRASVEKVSAEFERLEALFLGTEDDGKPSIAELITVRRDGNGTDNGDSQPVMACPHCGEPNNAHTPLRGSRKRVPWRGSVAICTTCWKVSVFDTNPIGEMTIRAATPAETVRFAQDEELQQSIVRMRQISVTLGISPRGE